MGKKLIKYAVILLIVSIFLVNCTTKENQDVTDVVEVSKNCDNNNCTVKELEAFIKVQTSIERKKLEAFRVSERISELYGAYEVRLKIIFDAYNKGEILEKEASDELSKIRAEMKNFINTHTTK